MQEQQIVERGADRQNGAVKNVDAGSVGYEPSVVVANGIKDGSAKKQEVPESHFAVDALHEAEEARGEFCHRSR